MLTFLKLPLVLTIKTCMNIFFLIHKCQEKVIQYILWLKLKCYSQILCGGSVKNFKFGYFVLIW